MITVVTGRQKVERKPKTTTAPSTANNIEKTSMVFHAARFGAGSKG